MISRSRDERLVREVRLTALLVFGSERRLGTKVPVRFLKHEIPCMESRRSNDQNMRARKVVGVVGFATDNDNPSHNGSSKINEASLDCT